MMPKPMFNFTSIEKRTQKPKWDPQEFVFSEQVTMRDRNSIRNVEQMVQATAYYKYSNLQISLPLH